MDELGDWLEQAYPSAFRTAYLVLRNRDDAAEAVQEAFLRVWRFRAALPAAGARRAWLYRVVVNACLSRLRTDQHWRDRLGDQGLDERPGTAPDPAAAGEASALGRAVAAALADLPDSLRVPVILRYYTGLDEREIAAAIRRRPGTVKSRLFHARQRLAADPRLLAWLALEDAR